MSGTAMEQVAVEAGVELAKSAAERVFTAITRRGKLLKKELEVELGLTFRKYLAYSRENNSQVKTLLYRQTPKYLYDFYECVSLVYQNKVVDAADVNNLLDLGHRLLITGSGGVGKSMMMRHFFLNTIERTDLVPLLVELRGLNNREYQGLEEYLRYALAQQRLVFQEEDFRYSLEAGCYLFLLDGYDEVRGDLSPRVAEDIQDLSSRFPENWYILSSRSLPEFIGWKNFRELRALPMSKRQALRMIRRLDYDPAVKERFCRELDRELYGRYQTFASNPLLLTIMFLTFGNCAAIPETLNEFYEQAFHTLFSEHDASKGAYRRDIFSQLGYDEFKGVFSYFCFKSFFESQHQFTAPQALGYINAADGRVRLRRPLDSEAYLRDLTESVCMLVREGLYYRFAHRSFQEYFAAVYTTQLSDEQQKGLLLAWMGERDCRRSSRYLDMLWELEPARFEENILLPVLREMREKASALGPHGGVRLLFSAGGLRFDDEEKFSWVPVVELNNTCYPDILRRACRLAGYCPQETYPKEQEEETARWFLETYPAADEDPWETTVSFDRLEQEGNLERAWPLFAWQEQRFQCAMAYLEERGGRKAGQMQTFSAILGEL